MGEDLIQTTTRLPAETQDDYVQTGAYSEDRIGSFNWLTGTQMNVFNHERLTYMQTFDKKVNFTAPVLSKFKGRQSVEAKGGK